MKYFTSLRPLGLKIRLMSFIFLLFGIHAPALGQAIGDPNNPDDVTNFWAYWMINPTSTGPRFYLSTERDILQSSWSKASFQRGSLSMVVADGSVGKVWRDQIVPFFEEWDTDRDGWRDVVEEDADPPTDPFDPFSFPTVIPPDVFWTVLANGIQLPVDRAGSTAAIQIRPFSYPSTALAAAPPSSDLPRPLVFNDYSTQFYIVNPNTSTVEPFGLSLYNYSKSYPDPEDVGAMERDLVEGVYLVEYPIISSPYQKAGAQATHHLVPNGTFTIGAYKKPTWLLRSVESLVSLDEPPVPQNWVTGQDGVDRLRFDPEVVTTFRWDDLAQLGLASPILDGMTVRIEDEGGDQTWPPTGASVAVSLVNPQVTLQMRGQILPPQVTDENQPPSSINGFMVFQYSRNLGIGSSGEVSTVTLRVPIEMRRSYASYRLGRWPGPEGLDNSISGPSADPDGDGLTNEEEFEQGSNPNVPTIGVSNPISANTIEDPYNWTTTLDATVLQDPASLIEAEIYERGMVYAPSFVNPFPLIDGPGVIRVVDGAPGVGDYTFELEGLTDTTQYSSHAYVITDLGTFYSSSVSIFSTPELPPVTIPTVTSPSSSSITALTASLGGNVTSDGGGGGAFNLLTERGVVYSLTSDNDNPFIGGFAVTQLAEGGVTTGVFTVGVTGLLPGATYSFRAYAINSVGTSHTSSIGTFSTPAASTAPTIILPTSTDITSISAILGGNVTNDGGASVLQRGVVFSSTNTDPEIGGAGVIAFAAPSTGTGVFTVNATVSPGETYYFKAYALNLVGISYTTVGMFVTPGALATITNPTILGFTSDRAGLAAEVTSDGAAAITERGFVYSPTDSNSNPTIGGPGVIQISVPGTIGVFVSAIPGLIPETGYTFKAYAINSAGTAYCAPLAFFTTLPPLTVTSPTVANITATTALLGGTVVSDEGTTATERGVVYSSTNNDPVIDGPGVTKVATGGTMGPFTMDVASLAPDTAYHFKAYATNSAGTSYSDVSTFSTLPVQLLGLAQLQWAEESSPQSAPALESSALTQPRVVPQFVYLREASEVVDSLNYQIEFSSDVTNWLPVDQDDWAVEESAEALTVTWISNNSPPANLFFRVAAAVANQSP